MRFRSRLCGMKNIWFAASALGSMMLMHYILTTQSVVRMEAAAPPEIYPLQPSPSSSNSSKHYPPVGFPGFENSNCSGAYFGKVKNSHFKRSFRRWDILDIGRDAQNCEAFRNMYGIGRYPPATQEENDFPLAFSLVFHKDFDQVLYLLRAVYHPHNLYCLHVDSKVNETIRGIVRRVADCIPNVFVASTLENVVYAGYTRLKADLNCMEDALAHTVKWRYFINMVGQQFPLRSNLEMVRILKLFNGSNDVEAVPRVRALRLTDRFTKKHITVKDSKTGMMRVAKTNIQYPPAPHGVEPVKGSAFGTFSRGFVEFMFENKVVSEFLNWTKNIYSPDEYVWSTIHHSLKLKPPGGYIGQPDAKPWLSTYANWGDKPCKGSFVRSICIFTPQDLPLLLSRHELFANKFYIDKDPGALHCLDHFLFNLSVSQTVRDLEYYRTLPFAVGGTLVKRVP